jgi:hypothetical protein
MPRLLEQSINDNALSPAGCVPVLRSRHSSWNAHRHFKYQWKS